jgi:hypothetical protein
LSSQEQARKDLEQEPLESYNVLLPLFTTQGWTRHKLDNRWAIDRQKLVQYKKINDNMFEIYLFCEV